MQSCDDRSYLDSPLLKARLELILAGDLPADLDTVSFIAAYFDVSFDVLLGQLLPIARIEIPPAASRRDVLYHNVQQLMGETNTHSEDLAAFVGVDRRVFDSEEDSIDDDGFTVDHWAKVAEFFGLSLATLVDRKLQRHETISMAIHSIRHHNPRAPYSRSRDRRPSRV